MIIAVYLYFNARLINIHEMQIEHQFSLEEHFCYTTKCLESQSFVITDANPFSVWFSLKLFSCNLAMRLLTSNKRFSHLYNFNMERQ